MLHMLATIMKSQHITHRIKSNELYPNAPSRIEAPCGVHVVFSQFQSKNKLCHTITRNAAKHGFAISCFPPKNCLCRCVYVVCSVKFEGSTSQTRSTHGQGKGPSGTTPVAKQPPPPVLEHWFAPNPSLQSCVLKNMLLQRKWESIGSLPKAHTGYQMLE